MRFTPKPECTDASTVRLRLPAPLLAEYRAQAQASDMDLNTVLRQALEYAAESDSGQTVKRTSKKQTREVTSD